MTTYYVSAIDGDDNDSGISQTDAWASIARVNAASFEPGDSVLFRRGDVWNGECLTVDDSGLPGLPIMLDSYGVASAPTLSNSGVYPSFTQILRLNGNWIMVRDLLITDCHEQAVIMAGDHNVLGGCEITDVGIGVGVEGKHNRIQESYIHDLHMIVDTPAPDDDFGAIAVVFFNGDNETHSNRIERCKAPSVDYGQDGGAFEIYGRSASPIERIYCHHNWIEGCDGVIEIGSNSRTPVNDVYVYLNSCHDNGRFSFVHEGGQFAVRLSNLQIFGNSINAYDPVQAAPITFSADLIGAERQTTIHNSIISKNRK
jgi:hypothetical protein